MNGRAVTSRETRSGLRPLESVTGQTPRLRNSTCNPIHPNKFHNRNPWSYTIRKKKFQRVLDVEFQLLSPFLSLSLSLSLLLFRLKNLQFERTKIFKECCQPILLTLMRSIVLWLQETWTSNDHDQKSRLETWKKVARQNERTKRTDGWSNRTAEHLGTGPKHRPDDQLARTPGTRLTGQIARAPADHFSTSLTTTS